LSCDEPDPGILQTLGFSTGFANGHCKYTSAVPVLFGFDYTLNWSVMIDDPRNTVLTMPPSLSHFSLEEGDQRRVEKVVKYYEDGLLAYCEMMK